MCGKNGIMSGKMGLISFRNVTMASNKQFGFEMERIVDGENDENNILGGIIVGSSQLLGGYTTAGMVGPQSSKWLVSGVHFYHFTDGYAGISTCSHCETPEGDSGAREYRFEKLYWHNVTKRVNWLVPKKGILHDLDGTLTELGPDSYVTPFYNHNNWPECTKDLELFTGIICPHPWSVRRIVFHEPHGNIDRKDLNIWRYDDSIVADKTE